MALWVGMGFDIIVPIYRISEELILRAFDSIKAQSFTDYEVYVCDGTPLEHSIYDAQAVVECYGFNYLRQDHAHTRVGGARNQAVAKGSNPYIAFLDGDDYWYPKYLSEMNNAIEKSNKSVIIWSAVCDCTYKIESGKTGEIHEMQGLYGHYEDTEFLNQYPDFAYYHFFGHPPAPTTTIVEREAFLSVGGFSMELSILEDTDCWMRMVGDPRKIPIENRGWF